MKRRSSSDMFFMHTLFIVIGMFFLLPIMDLGNGWLNYITDELGNTSLTTSWTFYTLVDIFGNTGGMANLIGSGLISKVLDAIQIFLWCMPGILVLSALLILVKLRKLGKFFGFIGLFANLIGVGLIFLLIAALKDTAGDAVADSFIKASYYLYVYGGVTLISFISLFVAKPQQR